MPDSTEIESTVDRILTEGPIGMSAAARLYGSYRAGRPTHPSTPTRHHLHGVTLPDGRVVHLEAVRIAGRLMTSRGAIVRFLTAQQPDAQHSEPSTPPPSPAVRRCAAEGASKVLDELGI